MHNELLIIEDTPVHLSILRKIASQEGFEATCVETVESALEVLHKRSFDCITLDMSLGERCGDEILAFLAQLNSRTPILMISGVEGDEREDHLRFAMSLGLVVYPQFSKPVDLPALRKTLREIATITGCQKIVDTLGNKAGSDQVN